MMYLLVFIYPYREVAASLFPPEKQCQPNTVAKYAMRAQNQAIIMDENTVSYYINRGYIDIGSCAVAFSRNSVG
jgi:hypothetical protein